MTPTPQEHDAVQMGDVAPPTGAGCDGDKVVISGMAGLYPKSRYVKDLENILYNKLNPVSADDLRWTYNHPEVAQYTGNVPDLDRFDAQFFKVHYHLGNSMDSMSRKLLEQSYEAIYDAGLNPGALSGKKVGVYIGTCFSETEKVCFYVANTRNGLGIAGCSKTMFANRVSYWLNAKGPSMSIDEACCSSTAALEQAYQAISRGECEAAIVGGANLCLHPQSSVHYGRMMTISMDGKTKSFDEDAAGCAKSEAVNVLFLQKAKDALRIYAEVVNVKSEFVSILDGEVGPKYGFYRDPKDSVHFLKSFYDKTGVSPSVVEYVEAFGSAVPEADKSELEAIDKVFCEDRKMPLLIGSVMSNIGYGEAASGISAITKVLLGYHRGELAGNLHCETPRRDVAALQEGRMRVLTDNQRFQRTYTAVNSMSVTGVNAHVLLHGHYKPKDVHRYKTNIPRIVTVSGRQESSVNRVLDNLKSHSIDPEELALLHNIHEARIPGHLGRGFIILDTNADQQTVSLLEKAEYFDDAQRPLWFVYSGMGSQWAGMGAQLMQIPIFAAAIERCHRALQPKGLNIIHIITSPEKTIFDNILHSFVGIAAVQIGLTDVLQELGLVPDKIIGHSVGELGCAYADGCLTAEEMILSAYSRGLVSLETPLIRGSMAAVGMGFLQMSKICPPEIQVACHNSAESCTLSGPAEEMRSFVADLVAKGIFAKEVPCSNIAYHSRYIAEAGPALLKYLKEVIKTPKARSERWISTSVPQDRWQEPTAKHSSAEYHTNNLLSPVLFEEASVLIPSNAVLVEVAPHGLLQAILKRALPDSVDNIPLTRRGHPDNALLVLEAVGNLYMKGYNPRVRVLYPKVEFPVSTGTPFLSHLVEWVHQEKWMVPVFQTAYRTNAATCSFVISIHDQEYKQFKGHTIRSKTLVPFSFALVAAWDTLAMSLGATRRALPVQLRDVHLHAQPLLLDQRTVRLSVSLHRGTGRFEVMNEYSKVATGFITTYKAVNARMKYVPEESESNEVHELNASDVYRLLYEREYAYSGAFRSIHSANKTLTDANILWNGNWVTFIDGLIQLNILNHAYRGISLPNQIRKIVINVKEHPNIINKNAHDNSTTRLKAEVSYVQDRTRCGGVLIENMQFRYLPFENDDNIITLQTLKFIPRFNSELDVTTSLQVFLQIVAENTNKDIINVLGLKALNDDSPLFEDIEKINKESGVPGIRIQYRQIMKSEASYKNEKVDLVLVENLSKQDDIIQALYGMLQTNTFIINKEVIEEAPRKHPSKLYNVVSVLKNSNTKMELVVWRPDYATGSTTSAFTVNSESDLPLLVDTRNKLASQDSLMVLSTYPPVDGLDSLVRQWRRDSTRNRIHLVMVNNVSEEDAGHKERPSVDLAFNIIDKGVWGGEYYLPSLSGKSATHNKIKLQSKQIGNIDSLRWVQVPEPLSVGTLVTVHYVGVNVEDVKRALGVSALQEYVNENDYAMEFSGLTRCGERVMGLVPNGAASSHVMAQPELMWPVPPYWTLEDAATVPFAYVCAYYCLVIKTTIRVANCSGSEVNVLVHGGTGALGQAMISIALASGYRVFATVGDQSKKRFLLKLFPELNEKDIGNSRDESFGDLIINATKGKGCHFVICCLKGDLKNISLKCCGLSGILFDVAQIPNREKYLFGMSNLQKDRSYTTVDMTSIITNTKSEDLKKISLMISDGIARGHVRPLSRVTFSPHDAPRAFRLLAASRHRGRVLLRLQDSPPHAQPRFTCAAANCHIVFCDEQPLGLQLADKLVDCGVKKLHLYFQTLPSYLDYKLRVWKKLNVEVTLSCGQLNDLTVLLQKGTRLGPVEGVYVAVENIKRTTLAYLYLASRQLCPSLKHFLILSDDNSSGSFNSVSILDKKRLPGTILDLSLLEKFRDADGFTWYRGAAEAAERAVLSTDQVLVAQIKRSARLPLIQQIAAMTDLNISDDTSGNASLKELGMASEKSGTVCAFLRNLHNISLEEHNIPSLTLKKLKQMEASTTETELKEAKGLEAFYSYVDPDELLATTEIVFLPTLTNNFTMRDDEFNVNETCLCIVPGLEGHHARFRTLCERLKLPAFVLQPGLDHPDETPRELALRYSKVLLKKTGAKKTFHILGYETGVTVSLELAAILEDHGQSGTVFCIGDGPEETKAMLDVELRAFGSEEALREGVARHMFSLMARGSAAPAQSALRGCASWRTRVDVCVRTILGQVSHSAQYARALVETAYSRIVTARHYNSAIHRALRSRIVLLRVRGSNDAGNGCSLQRYSQQTLIVRDLTMSMAHAVADLRVSAIINEYLDEEILQAYERKNLCDSYLTNADAFMSC